MTRYFDFLPPPITTFYRDATVTLDLTLHFAAPSAVTFLRQTLYVVFSYIDSSGILRTESVDGGSVVAGSSEWAGLWSGYSARKISITTSYQVKQNTLVSCSVRLTDVCPTGTLQYLFIDPDIEIA